MFSMEWEDGEWRRPRIVPYGPIAMEPGNATLHYGQAVFEGMKAFRGGDGRVRIFRPDMNARRLEVSCDRLCVPRVDPEVFLGAVERLVAVDRAWIPARRGGIALHPPRHLRQRGAYGGPPLARVPDAGHHLPRALLLRRVHAGGDPEGRGHLHPRRPRRDPVRPRPPATTPAACTPPSWPAGKGTCRCCGSTGSSIATSRKSGR